MLVVEKGPKENRQWVPLQDFPIWNPTQRQELSVKMVLFPENGSRVLLVPPVQFW